jgi:hypothetical protein
MEALKSPLFITSCILFIVHQLLQHVFKINIPLADEYLDNLLAMPIILPLLLVERRYLFKRGSTYRLPLLESILATIYVSLISELLFPLLSSRFTFDWLDFVFFFAGAGVYLVVEAYREKKKDNKLKELSV